jgi:hypothetical protein
LFVAVPADEIGADVQAELTLTSQATTTATHSTRNVGAGNVSEGSDVEELLQMKRLLAEKLGEAHPAQPKQGKPFHLLPLSKTVLRTPSGIEEDSGCGTSTPSTPSMCSSRQESPRPLARVLVKDGLAYVVR